MTWAEWEYKMEMNVAWDINVAWNDSSERCELLHSFQEEFSHPLSSLTEMKSEAHLSLALHPSLLSALQHLNFLYRVHLKERRGEQVGENKFTYPQRFSDLNKRPRKVDHSGVIQCFWEIQPAQRFKRRELQISVLDILRGGVFFISIFYGEMSPVLQGPLSCRIYTGKKNIGLWDILYVLCYWWCYPFPIWGLLPAMLLFSLSPSSSCTSYSSPSSLFPLSPPTADICRSTVFAFQKKKKEFHSILHLPFYLGDIFPKRQQKRTLTKANCLWMPSFLGCVPRVKFKMTLPGWRSGSMATTEAPETPSSCENWQTTELSGFYTSSRNLGFLSYMYICPQEPSFNCCSVFPHLPSTFTAASSGTE